MSEPKFLETLRELDHKLKFAAAEENTLAVQDVSDVMDKLKTKATIKVIYIVVLVTFIVFVFMRMSEI